MSAEMHLLAGVFQDCGHLNWRVDEVKYVGISSCKGTELDIVELENESNTQVPQS